MMELRPQSNISIHALRKESDSRVGFTVVVDSISIHALRKESDVPSTPDGTTTMKDFNPRSP